MRIGYKNAWILTMDNAFTEYRSGYLVMEGHLIVEVGAMDQFEEKKADDWIDAQGASWIRERSYALWDDSFPLIRG